jgi:hypothetical protein
MVGGLWLVTVGSGIGCGRGILCAVRDPAQSHRCQRPPQGAEVDHGPGYIAREPEMAREMTSRWISEVPSKMV